MTQATAVSTTESRRTRSSVRKVVGPVTRSRKSLEKGKQKVVEDDYEPMLEDSEEPTPPKKTTPSKRKGKTFTFDARFDLIRNNRFLVERAFDLKLIESMRFVKSHLLAHKWESMISRPCKVNETLVREFYAMIGSTKNDIIIIRGRRVCWTAPTLNSILGLAVPVVCSYRSLENGVVTVPDDDIAAAITLPGHGWSMDDQRKIIMASHLTLEAGLWFQFIRHNIMPTVHDRTLSRAKCLLIYCVIKDMPINVGGIAYQAIMNSTVRATSRLIFPGLITKLLAATNVPERDTDIISFSKSLIDQGTVTKMHKPNRDDLVDDASGPRATAGHATSATRTSAAPNATTFVMPPIPPSATGYGSEVWLTMLVETMTRTQNHLKRMSERLDQMSDRLYQLDDRVIRLEKKHQSFWAYSRDRDRVHNHAMFWRDPLRAASLPRFPIGLCPPQVRMGNVPRRAAAPPVQIYQTTDAAVPASAAAVSRPSPSSVPATVPVSTMADVTPNPNVRGGKN